MTQGIFIHGTRPKSKKQVKEYVEGVNNGTKDAYGLVIEATSMFGDEFDGSLAKAQEQIKEHGHFLSSPNNQPIRIDKPFNFVGPDPHTQRSFYGWIAWSDKLQKWQVR